MRPPGARRRGPGRRRRRSYGLGEAKSLDTTEHAGISSTPAPCLCQRAAILSHAHRDPLPLCRAVNELLGSGQLLKTRDGYRLVPPPLPPLPVSLPASRTSPREPRETETGNAGQLLRAASESSSAAGKAAPSWLDQVRQQLVVGPVEPVDSRRLSKNRWETPRGRWVCRVGLRRFPPVRQDPQATRTGARVGHEAAAGILLFDDPWPSALAHSGSCLAMGDRTPRPSEASASLPTSLDMPGAGFPHASFALPRPPSCHHAVSRLANAHTLPYPLKTAQSQRLDVYRYRLSPRGRSALSPPFWTARPLSSTN